MLKPGEYFAEESSILPGEWGVMRRSEENPGAWDRGTLWGLPSRELAEAIAELLTRGVA